MTEVTHGSNGTMSDSPTIPSDDHWRRLAAELGVEDTFPTPNPTPTLPAEPAATILDDEVPAPAEPEPAPEPAPRGRGRRRRGGRSSEDAKAAEPAATGREETPPAPARRRGRDYGPQEPGEPT